MCAPSHNLKIDFVAWHQELEAVWKDIECIFGVLKHLCRIFKTPYTSHEKDDILSTLECVHQNVSEVYKIY